MTKEKKTTSLLPRILKGLFPNRPGLAYLYGGLLPFKLITGSEDNFIKEGYAGNADLFSVVDYILSLAPNVRPMLVEIDAKGEEKEISKHELLDLLKNPGDGLDYAQWIGQVLGYRLITGNAFIEGIKMTAGQKKGKPVVLRVLPSQYTEVKKSRDGLSYVVTIDGVKTTYKAEDIGHLKARQFIVGQGAELRGMSPILAATRDLTSSNSGKTSKVAKFQNGGVDGIVGLEHPEAGEEAVRNVKQDFYDQNTGPDKQGRLMVVTGKASFTRFGLSPVDLQTIEGLRMDLQTFCRIYKIDAKLVDPQAPTTYNNMREAKSAAYSMAVIPIVNELFSLLNRWIVPTYQKEGQTLKLKADYSQIPEMQKDIESMSRALNTVRWALSINEARWYLDLPPVDDEIADIPQGLLDELAYNNTEPTPMKSYEDYRR